MAEVGSSNVNPVDKLQILAAAAAAAEHLPENLAAGKAELGTALDDDQETIDEILETPGENPKKRDSMTLDADEPTTPKKARTYSEPKATTPPEPMTPAKTKPPRTAKAKTPRTAKAKTSRTAKAQTPKAAKTPVPGDTTEEEPVTLAKSKKTRAQKIAEKGLPNLDGNADDEDDDQGKTDSTPANEPAEPIGYSHIGAKTAKSSKVLQTSLNASNEDVEAGPSTGPITPTRAMAAKKSGTPKTLVSVSSKDEADKKPSGPRKRGPVKSSAGIAAPVGLPTSWETTSDADKKLIEMKEAKNSWSDIRDMWQLMTGQVTAGSTLPNRYNRLKVNLERLQPAHQSLLVSAVAVHERNKWQNIAKQVADDCGKSYAAAFLQKEFKKIEEAQSNRTFVSSTAAAATTLAPDDAMGQKSGEVSDGDRDEYGGSGDEADDDEPMADDGAGFQ